MLFSHVAGFAPPVRHERRTRTLEDLAVIRANRDAPPPEVELLLVRRGAVVERMFRCPTCEGPPRRALYDPDDGQGWQCRACCHAEHASRFEERGDRDPLTRARTLRRRLG